MERITYKDLMQRSPEWRELRRGKITASQVAPILTGKSLGAGARTLAMTLVAEKYVEPEEGFVSYPMERGIELEPEAIEIYKRATGREVEDVGGIQLGEHLWYSPDGLTGTDTTVEIKCPMPKKHVEILTSVDLLPEYMPQIQFGLYVSGRKRCDFVTFNPDFPPNLAMRIITVERDEEIIEQLKERTELLIVEINKLWDRLKSY